jgi:hypothetical protein
LTVWRKTVYCSLNNRRARLYELTVAGRRQLDAERASMDEELRFHVDMETADRHG